MEESRNRKPPEAAAVTPAPAPATAPPGIEQPERSCLNCIHAVEGRFVPLGEHIQMQPGARWILMGCAKDRWPSVIQVMTLTTHRAQYAKRGRACPDFRAHSA